MGDVRRYDFRASQRVGHPVLSDGQSKSLRLPPKPVKQPAMTDLERMRIAESNMAQATANIVVASQKLMIAAKHIKVRNEAMFRRGHPAEKVIADVQSALTDLITSIRSEYDPPDAPLAG